MITQQKIGRVVQPSDIFKMLNIKNTNEAERVLSTILYLLVYMKPGDKLETTVANFEKIASDLLYVDCSVSGEYLVDELVRKKIIKLPL